MKKNETDNSPTGLTDDKILDAARAQVRRFGEAKTNVVDIARALGISHTTIYRHFKSKSEVFDALVKSAMEDEQELAATFCQGAQTAGEKLCGLVTALHRRKKERFTSDNEVYMLYKRVVEERPEIVRDYAEKITRLLEIIIQDGIEKGEFAVDDVQIAAQVVRDAVTIFVHPAHVADAAKAGIDLEIDLKRVMITILTAFKHSIEYR